MRHGMAQGYRWWFGCPVPYTAPNNRANLPAGFILASAKDMGHFLIAQMNGGRYQDQSVLSAEKIGILVFNRGINPVNYRCTRDNG